MVEYKIEKISMVISIRAQGWIEYSKMENGLAGGLNLIHLWLMETPVIILVCI